MKKKRFELRVMKGCDARRRLRLRPAARAHRARAGSPRDSARMLVVAPDGALTDARVSDLPDFLRPGDALVVNDTKVIAARLDGVRVRGEAVAAIEATLIKRIDDCRWRALVRRPRSSRSASASGSARRARAWPACSPRSTPRSRRRARPARSRCASTSPAPRSTRRSSASARSRCRPISPPRRAPGEKDRADYQTMFAARAGRGRRADRGAAFHAAAGRAHRRARRRAASGDAACRRRDLPAGQGRGHRATTSCTASGARSTPRRPTRSTRARAAGGRIVCVGTTSARILESAADEHGPHSPVRRRDGDLHHARLPLPRRRRAHDQFPSAALDAVHAGQRLQRARDDAGRLRARDRRRAIASIPTATPAC